ncbi:MAG: NADP-dependent oxidoreductase, partial [Pyrinomonadaceae bacterium]
MSQPQNTRIVLASRPLGPVKPDNFRIETQQIPAPGDGEILLKILFLSLDPYMRGRMDDAESYAAPVAVNAVMEGGTVAEVVESRHPDFHPGDIVLSHSGWQSYAISNGV